MNNAVILTLIMLLILIIIIICLYFISRQKQQAIQVFTLESFLNIHHMSEYENPKKSFVNTINDFFYDKDNDGLHEDLDNGDCNDDGDDSGE